MAVRATGRLDACGHGHIADSVGAADAERRRLRRSAAIWRTWKRNTVKPSAQPTLVRTQHLPPPAKTARWLRKRGPAGRFLLVTPCISACHCGSMYGSVRVHMVYSVRAKLAVRITAPFADLCPFCPVSWAPDCRASRLAGSHAARAGRRAGLVRTRGRGGQAAGSARAISSRLHGGDRLCVAATGMGDQHDAVASGAVPGAGHRGEPRRHAPRVPGVPGQGLDPAEPVIYLAWTGDGPVMYLPYTCAGDTLDHGPRCPLVAAVSKAPGRLVDVDLAKEPGGVP